MSADRLLTAVLSTGVAVLVVATVLSLGMSLRWRRSWPLCAASC
jgi:hypothetical protein